ncbi:MAG TPA: hypothetical protein VFU21_29240, partial [Kofleriaceae bacterium]|nr:hypothetical protein [Kofleriaceae bacterium]
DLIEARLDRLPPATRGLLEVIAVAGQPVEEAVVLRAAELEAGGHVALDELRRAHLVTGTSGGAVQPTHDRISELIAGRLGEGERGRLHLALARALEKGERIDPELIAVHYRAAGAGERAIRYLLVAAAQAAEALAFHRAARLYEVALDLWTGDDAGRRRILADQAEALAHAGHGPEAARAFAAAADLAPGVEGLELRRRAAEQLLRSGHIDDGLAALERVLSAHGLRLALTPRRAVLSLLKRRVRVRLRGLGFVERGEVELDAAARARIDTCWSVAVVFGMVDPIRASDFQSRHLLLALDAGDPRRIARALATEAVYSATRGVVASRRSAELVDAAAAIAARTGKPYEGAFAILGAGMVAYWEGRHRAARDLCEKAERTFRDECPGIIWEVSSTRIVGIWSLCYLGQLGELRRRVLAYLSEAEERGDLYLATSVQTGVPSLAWLAADDQDGARRHLLEGMKLWSQRGFHVQHYWKFLAQTQLDLYAGDGESAWMRVGQSMPALRRSLLLRVAVVRVEASYLVGRAAVAAASCVPVGERRAYLRAADGEAATLRHSSEPWARPLGLAVAAGAAAVRGETERAAQLFGEAAGLFDDAGMALHAAVSRRRRGQLVGGDEGARLVASAAEVIRGCGVVASDRMSALLMPGVAD